MIMRKETGFTLSESLIVLAITGVLLLIAVPVSANHLEQYKERAFLEMLEMDLLYAQSEAMSKKEMIMMQFREEEYSIFSEYEKGMIIKKLPKQYKFIGYGSAPIVSFTTNGSIRKSGQISFKSKNNKYRLILPPGKGRGRFERE